MVTKEPLLTTEQQQLEEQVNDQSTHQVTEAFGKERGTDEILGTYLEKSGYPFDVHLQVNELKILEKYRLSEGEARSLQAWSQVYDAEDALDAYLEKSGYPHDKVAS